MTTTTRAVRRAGVGLALTIALAAPAAGVAQAAPVHPTTATITAKTVTASTVSASTRRHARVVLRQQLAAADKAFRVARRAAAKSFDQDADVVLAKAQRLAIVSTSTDPAIILAANQAYALAVEEAAETRTAAVDTAREARFIAVDNAWAQYDATVHPKNAAARTSYRLALRAAHTELRTRVQSAHKAFRTSVAPAHAQLRASINLAIATYEASGKTPADKTAFECALAAARSAYAGDAAVVAAKAVRHTSLSAAWHTYATQVQASRVAFKAATGHWPHRWIVILPKV